MHLTETIKSQRRYRPSLTNFSKLNENVGQSYGLAFE